MEQEPRVVCYLLSHSNFDRVIEGLYPGVNVKDISPWPPRTFIGTRIHSFNCGDDECFIVFNNGEIERWGENGLNSLMATLFITRRTPSQDRKTYNEEQDY